MIGRIRRPPPRRALPPQGRAPRLARAAGRDATPLGREVLAALSDVVLRTDRAGRILELNPAWTRSLGYSPAQSLGRPLGEFAAAEDRASLAAFVAAATGERRPVRLLARDGSERWFDLSLHGLAGAAGRGGARLVCAADITERRRDEQELARARSALEAAQRVKGNFLSNMSHEFRTPLGIIIGMTELALDAPLGEEARGHIELAKTAADELLTLVNALLDFSRLETNRLELEHIAFSLRDCLAMAVSAIAPRAAQKGLRLNADYAADLPAVVVGDPLRLRQVIINLLGNAVKFTDAGSVRLRAGRGAEPGTMACTITDTGVGIAPELRERIFDSFTQADATAARRHGGAGLGLALCARLVTRMGGRIWVESEPGSGSSFHFTVRLTERQAPALPGHGPTRLEGRTAVVVSDHRAQRDLLAGVLKGWQMRPLPVADMDQARAELAAARRQGQPASVLLLDCHSPECDGIAMAQALREELAQDDARVVLLTAAGMRGDAARGRDSGISAYLTRPVSASELAATLRICLALPADAPSLPITRHSLRESRRHLNVLVAGWPGAEADALCAALVAGGHAALRPEQLAAAALPVDAILVDADAPRAAAADCAGWLGRLPAEGGAPPLVGLSQDPHGAAGRDPLQGLGPARYLAKPLDPGALLSLLEQPAATAAAAGPLFDRVAVLANLDGDVDLLRALAATFLDDSARSLGSLGEAISRQDWERCYRIVHSLKGAAANFGAEPVIFAAKHIETVYRSGDHATLPSLAAAFDEMIRDLSAELRRELGA